MSVTRQDRPAPPGARAVLEYYLLGYRRTWRASVLSSFLLPVLTLLGFGVGVGGYVDQGLDGVPYLHWIVYAIIGGYLLLSLVIGLRMSRRASRNAESYFLGGRTLPWWATGISLAATSGVHSYEDVIKLLLVGADVCMLTSVLLTRGVDYLAELLEALQTWLDLHDYESVEQLKGSMSYGNCPNAGDYERANYMKAIVSYTAVR